MNFYEGLDILPSMVTAPSNIALIKYMGKISANGNKPTNASFSYTLNHLTTAVELVEADKDSWHPLELDNYIKPELSQKGIARYLDHFKKLKEELGINKSYTISSASNFPSDCGLASSASSFAALTKAANQVAAKKLDKKAIAALSQKGSGSSCRSFMSPWCVWDSEGVHQPDIKIQNLYHQVIILDDKVKEVSSSAAHLKVLTSPLFVGRVKRAEERLSQLLEVLDSDWKKAYQICWDEFIDMHKLFETSKPAFGYRTEETNTILDNIKKLWDSKQDGPLVTMDAGPNIHLLYKNKELAKDFQEICFKGYKVYSS